MQELEFVPEDSDSASLVLRTAGSSDTASSATPQSLDPADAAVAAKAGDTAQIGESPEPVAPVDAAKTTTDSETLYWVPVTDALRQFLATENTHSGAVEAVGGTLSLNLSPHPTQPPTEDTSTAQDSDGAAGATLTGAEAETPETLVSVTPASPPREAMKLRPREIQKHLRHGATVAELSAETGIPESRLLPYAHPIDMERNRIADLARQAYPVRADGPAEHTLWEVLATSFGARGEDVRASTWNAAMDSSDTWIISVSWTRGNRRGASEFIAEFRWIPASPPGVGPSTVEPVNSVASDLIDPRFSRPVRSVGPVSPTDPTNPSSLEFDSQDLTEDDASDSGDAPVDLFSRDPTDDAPSHPAKRRRSNATPHWEDVLLGVRTSPRRKK